MSRARARTVIGLMILAGLCGCSFDRNWRDMKRAQLAGHVTPASKDRLAGRWEGRWVSEVNGHSGRLRAIITPIAQTATPNIHYRADFDASFFGLMRFGYGMTLVATSADPTAGTISFQGEEDLGNMAGGVYRYTGTTDGKTFNATYESRDDRGTFQMTRP